MTSTYSTASATDKAITVSAPLKIIIYLILPTWILTNGFRQLANLLNLVRARQYIDFRWMGGYHLKRHMKPILILFAQSLAISIYTNLDTVMLGFLKTDTDVGYYNAAVKIKSILVSLVTSLGNVLLPRMSYYAKERKKREFMDVYRLCTWMPPRPTPPSTVAAWAFLATTTAPEVFRSRRLMHR